MACETCENKIAELTHNNNDNKIKLRIIKYWGARLDIDLADQEMRKCCGIERCLSFGDVAEVLTTSHRRDEAREEERGERKKERRRELHGFI